ncbi:MAG TPA: peptidoglycan-binding domain-containing protein [Pyrinomonadaceae bacterium]|jgi:hypothetical protein
MEKNHLFREIRSIAGFGTKLAEYEVSASIQTAHAEGYGFYYQFNNADILSGNGNKAGGRTCNITCISMILESFGITKENTNPDINKEALEKLAKFYANKLENRSLYDLRYPDFLQILAIYLKLGNTNAFGANEINAARAKAAASITSWSFMDKITESFARLSFESASVFTHSINSGLKEIGRKTRVLDKSEKNKPANPAESRKNLNLEAEKVINLNVYKEKVINSMNQEIRNGFKIIVHQYNHFTVLLDVNENEVRVNNPGQRNGGNMKLSWERARNLGMFSGYMRCRANGSPVTQKVSGNGNKTAPISNNLRDAVLKNRKLSKQLGWDKYIYQINDFLLPFSGYSNVSLGEEAFANALKEWQRNNGLGDDGVLGPKSWAAIKQALKIGGNQTTVSSPGASGKTTNGAGNFKPYKNGWKAFGGGTIKDKLRELQSKRLLAITDTEIEIFSILAEKEADGYVSVINSWDDSYMSMGFFQFPVIVGKLQKVIELAPDAFRKYGIELDYSRRYQIGKNQSDNPTAIKNAPEISNLRQKEWAQRFYQAGLEDDVIIAQIKLGRKIFYEDLLKKNDPNNYLERFKTAPPNLWAFIFEADNSRPAPFRAALRAAIKEAQSKNINDFRAFAPVLIRALRGSTEKFYSERKYDKNPVTNEINKQAKIKYELGKIDRIIKTTGINKF